jgi:hypothetical protein
MRRRRDGVAEPDAWQHGVIEHREPILRREPWQAIADQRALNGNGRRIREVRVAQHLLGDRAHGQAIAYEIEAGHLIVVEDATGHLWRSHDGVHRRAVIEPV